jgi:hypothetical protein
MLNPPQLAVIKDRDPYLYETLTQIVDEVNGIASQTGSSANQLAAPPNIAALNVVAMNGQFTIAITDPAGQAQPNLGLHYFLEYDTNPAFPNPTVEDIGPSRGKSLQLGNLTLYWRAYSGFRNSLLSKKVNFGGKSPTAVVGGGAAVPPPAGAGSGAAGGGGGFGGGGETRSRQTR